MMVIISFSDTGEEAPQIQITGQQYVERGDSIVLHCNATGEYYPPDEMDWFHDGHRMSSNERIFITKRYSIVRRTFTSTLKIKRASMQDSGTYVCRSSNMQITSTKVHVLNGKNFFVIIPTKLTLFTIHLFC